MQSKTQSPLPEPSLGHRARSQWTDRLRTESRPEEGGGSSTASGRVYMDPHMLNELETRKMLFSWDGIELTGSVSGKS